MQKGDAMDAAERSERIPDIVIITGMSGSGRTQAMHVFEDMGYFCIDNLPRVSCPACRARRHQYGRGRHLAVTCDLRSQGLFDEISMPLPHCASTSSLPSCFSRPLTRC